MAAPSRRCHHPLLYTAILLHMLSKSLPKACAQSQLTIAWPPTVENGTNFGLPAKDTVEMIYNDGYLQNGWTSWSWGLEGQNLSDISSPANGSHASYCVSIQPFGALSLKADTYPIKKDISILGFFLRGSTVNKSTAAAGGGAGPPLGSVGDLELQLESSEGDYFISRSISLRDLLIQQAAEDGTDAVELLQQASNGQWITLSTPLQIFDNPETGEPTPATYDRITLGQCLQGSEPCDSPNAASVSICLDHLVVVSTGVEGDTGT